MNVQDFLENIQPNEKMGILSHIDLDGIVSEILFYDFLNKKGCKNISVFFRDYNVNLMDELHEELENLDKLVVLDLSSNVLGEQFQKLGNEKDILYIDHHFSEIHFSGRIIELKTPSEICVTRTLYETLKNKLGKKREWLVVAGIISDAGDRFEINNEIINHFLKTINLSIQDFKEKIVFNLAYFLDYFHDDLTGAFHILRDLDNYSDVSKLEKYIQPVKDEFNFYLNDFKKNKKRINGVEFYLFNSKFPIKSSLINELSYSTPRDIFLIGTLEGDFIKFSARCQSGKINLVEFLKTIGAGCENALSGGHLKAAGIVIRKQDLEIFKNNLMTLKNIS